MEEREFVYVKERSTCGEPCRLSENEKQKCVEQHNRNRRKEEQAADMTEMVWDEAIAERAQELADTCVFDHGLKTACDGSSMGQNLYISTQSMLNVKSAIKKWYSEKPYYNFESGICTDDEMCGHYTQVVWAESTHVGCAVTYCDSLTVGNNTWSDSLLFVCNYAPVGNIVGQSPYRLGAECSLCHESLPNTGSKCQDGLCAACLPQDDAECECAAGDTSCSAHGTFNPGTCACRCNDDYYGANCETSCACEDAAGYSAACASWRDDFCADPLYTAFMTSTCRSTCGFCSSPPGTCGN